jgi:hypothetical protein
MNKPKQSISLHDACLMISKSNSGVYYQFDKLYESRYTGRGSKHALCVKLENEKMTYEQAKERILSLRKKGYAIAI